MSVEYRENLHYALEHELKMQNITLAYRTFNKIGTLLNKLLFHSKNDDHKSTTH